MRLILALITTLLLPTLALAKDQTLQLTGGTTTQIPGSDLSLTLTNVQDSRCNPLADCVWEGMIRVTIAVSGGKSAPQTIDLCNMCDGATRKATIAGWTVELVRLEPSQDLLYAMNRLTVLQDYTVELMVKPKT